MSQQLGPCWVALSLFWPQRQRRPWKQPCFGLRLGKFWSWGRFRVDGTLALPTRSNTGNSF